MTDLIIYTDTHRDACIDTCDPADADVYDENISAYYEFLEDQAKQASINLIFESSGGGRTTYTESDDGQDFVDGQPDFWQWFN